MSRPEFTPSPESPIDHLRRWVGEQLGKALDAALTGRFSLVGAALLLALIGLVIWLLIRLFRSSRAELRAGAPAVANVRRPPQDWLAEAAACEARGDFQGAVRARYRALISELATRGVVDDIPGRTSGEYRRGVTGDLPRVARDFGQATDLFELAVYGSVATGPDEAARLAQCAVRVLAGAR